MKDFEKEEEMKKRGIIFDHDGVLVDSMKLGRGRFLVIAKDMALPVGERVQKQIGMCWGAPIKLLARSLWPRMGADDAERFHDIWLKIDESYPFPLFPGVTETLSKLCSGGSALSVFSNRTRVNLCACLTGNNIIEYFPMFFGSDSSDFSKPDPRSIESILQYYRGEGIVPGELIYVGDSPTNDWPIANAHGLDFIAVASSISLHERFLDLGIPESRIIERVTDLPQVLEEWK